MKFGVIEAVESKQCNQIFEIESAEIQWNFPKTKKFKID